jgi:hypothetical protein
LVLKNMIGFGNLDCGQGVIIHGVNQVHSVPYMESSVATEAITT